MLQFCEICFQLPNEAGIIQISTCQHMVCRRCKKSPSRCSVCQKACRFAELGTQDTPEKLLPYFDSDPGSRAQQVSKIEQFQLEKMNAFLAGKIHAFEEYEQKKKEVRKRHAHAETLKKAMVEEEALIRKLLAQGSRSRSSSSSSSSGRAASVVVEHHGQKRPRPVASLGSSSGTSRDSLRYSSVPKRLTPESAFKVPTFSPSYGATPPSSSAQHSRGRLTDSGFPRSGSVHSLPGHSGSSHSNIVRKPVDLLAATRQGIVQETVRNINRAINRPPEAVQKVNNRGSSIERARNVYY